MSEAHFFDKRSTGLLIQVAIMGMREGLHPEARAILNGLDIGRPGFEMTAPMRAFSLVLAGDYQAGKAMLESIVEEQPNNMTALAILATFLDAEQDPTAEELAKKVLQSNADVSMKEMVLVWCSKDAQSKQSPEKETVSAVPSNRNTFIG